ncbi:hypothetical protein [Amycolatopsis sp. NBC_00438]|uniref:hypothetical protein n=1 Tax=Amycolatopsis sp. NBC_00438 TaxID=2903558 RepID=UPI002E1CFE71
MFQATKIPALAAAVPAAATLGATPTQAAGTVVTHDLAVTAAQRQAALDYWTPQRIAAMPGSPAAPPSTAAKTVRARVTRPPVREWHIEGL